MGNQEARAKGGEYVYRNDFVDGWERFSQNPCYETAKRFLEQAPEYAPMVFSHFAGCCPGGIFHRTGMVTAGNFSLGEYRLDMSLQEIKGLRELTKDEYAVFGRESMQDVIFHANPTEFVGRHWKMMVGTMEGKIYELGAILEVRAAEFTTDLPRDVFKHCELLLGTPTAEQQGHFIWDTANGSVIFQYAVIEDIFEADMFVSNRPGHRYGSS